MYVPSMVCVVDLIFLKLVYTREHMKTMYIYVPSMVCVVYFFYRVPGTCMEQRAFRRGLCRRGQQYRNTLFSFLLRIILAAVNF